MKRYMSLLFSFVIMSLITVAPGFGQAGCEFSVSGDWESMAPGQSSPNLYRFGSDGIVTAFSTAIKDQEPQKLGQARYKLQNSSMERTLEFRPLSGDGAFPSKLEITQIERTSFTAMSSGKSTNWTRKDPYRYFVVLAADRGTPPHNGGPAFAMLIKSSTTETKVETFGLYYRNGERINGPIPESLYRQFTLESLSPENALLRLEITPESFERAMKVMHNWQKRAKEGALLFPERSYLNIIVPLKEIAESVNQCGEDFHLYKLTWMVDDEIAVKFGEWEQAFQYVKKLRQLNEQLHLSDAKFQQDITSSLVLPQPKK